MNYPEHEKLQKIQAESQAVGEFLEWLQLQGYRICRNVPNNPPVHRTIQEWLEMHFEISGKKLDIEKREILRRLSGQKNA